MKRMVATAALALTTYTADPGVARSETARQPPDLTIDEKTREKVIETLFDELGKNYVFPEVAEEMEKAIKKRLKNKEYDKVAFGPVFADLLTLHLQEISHDKHLRVRYSVRPLPPRDNQQREPTPEQVKDYEDYGKRLNFGFERVERLPGNIGYLDLRGFFDASLGGETAASAMNLLANTEALIVDLRKNGGGDPAMVALISSYLFDAGEPVHLNDLYFRPANETHQWWTLPHVPGRRFGKAKDVYVLTSSRTFSAAEEFTYNLKNLKRATIVGETTGGGANPGDGFRLEEHFEMFVPTGRAINPISKINWEGTGVTPDVDVPADLALLTAQKMAMEKIAANAKDPELGAALKDTLAKVERDLDDAKAKLPAGPAPSLQGNTTFRLEGFPKARRVALVGAFNDWEPFRTLCGREGEAWICRVDLEPGKHLYRFVVDNQGMLDLANPALEVTEDGRVTSVRIVE